MKKMNQKGFTLIELLAVITIMGILMLVAIPAVQRLIRNTRRDTYADTAKQYINAIKTAVVSDDLVCCENSASCTKKEISTLTAGASSSSPKNYYYYFDSSQDSGKDLMDQGGKSSFANADVRGVIRIGKYVENNNIKYKYAIIMVDGTHGIGELKAATSDFESEENIGRSSVKMSGRSFNGISTGAGINAAKNDLCSLKG